MLSFWLSNTLIFLSFGFQVSSKEKLPQEFTAMRSALCDKPADFAETGCKVCPKFMDPEEPALQNVGLGIYSVLLGSFTAAGKTEALLSGYASCFGHAAGNASAFLLRKEQGSWRRISFFHNDGPVGICQKVPGQGDTRDLLVCNSEDYGAGAISVIAFDVDGKVKTNSTLVQIWTFPFRALEKQKHCSSFSADVKNISFKSIEISIFLISLDVDPPIDCDESETTTSKISNSNKIEAAALFIRDGDSFAPDEKTRKLLAEIEKRR